MVTIILPISRPHFLDKVFSALEMMNFDAKETNIFVYVDGNHALFELAQNFVAHSRFVGKYCIMRKKGQPTDSNLRLRRERIADIHNEIKQYLPKSDFIFSLEDDTVVPQHTLESLLHSYSVYPYAGFISGVEVGRWGIPAIGGWKANDVYVPTELMSILPKKDIEEVDAAGLYGCLIKTDRYMQHTFSPFVDILGPDVNFGLAMRQEGYVNYMDHSLRFMHMTHDMGKHKAITVENSAIVQVKYTKENDKWGYKIV